VDGFERRLRPLTEYLGPRSGNLEGFALAPTTGTDHWCFVTDDDNQKGEAILWFRQFLPAVDTDADSLSDDWELEYWGTTARTTGSADSDSDGMSNSDEQIAGTDPTDAASVFKLLSAVRTADKTALVLSWLSVSNRTYEVREAPRPEDDFTQVIQAAISATPPVNLSTVVVSTAVSGTFYRLAVRAP